MRRKILGVLVCMLLMATVVPAVLSENDNGNSMTQNLSADINALPITHLCHVNGTVVNASGQPLENVRVFDVVYPYQYLMAITDSPGAFGFDLWAPQDCDFSFERYGYMILKLSINIPDGQKKYDMGIITMEKQTFPVQGFGFVRFLGGVNATYGNATITLIKKVGLFRWIIDVQITRGEMRFFNNFKDFIYGSIVKAIAGPHMNVSLTSFFIPPDWLVEILNHPALPPMKVEGDVLHSLTGIGWYKITEN
jgi:hypothetical protein